MALLQELREAPFHFLVRESEMIALETLIVFLDGKVAALVEQGQGRGHGLSGHVELGGRHLQFLQFQKVGVEVLHRLEQERGRAAAKPEIIQQLRAEHVHQAERIENIGRIVAEMVAIVLFLKPRIAIFLIHSIDCRHSLNGLIEIIV